MPAVADKARKIFAEYESFDAQIVQLEQKARAFLGEENCPPKSKWNDYEPWSEAWAKWEFLRRLREAILKSEPLWLMCQARGHAKLATCADHVIPIRDGATDALDNLQPLCATCHSGTKASFERTGKLRGCDADGLPLDPRHHWNTAGGGGLNPERPAA